MCRMQDETPVKLVKASEALTPPVVVSAPPPRISEGPAIPLQSTDVGLSKMRFALAFVIAGISDVIAAFVNFAPPIAWPVDLITALLLFVALGWQWLFLPALIMEAIPGVGAFPFWVLVVMSIAIGRGLKGQAGKIALLCIVLCLLQQQLFNG
jgi:hypothetical protein